MDSVGAEVGQKMRSAIKAKLMELNCYVDDELPDYIMVMVANKRSKSQMNEDLQLFLASKTETFVDWLHIVLKKLKEVTVTNPEVYKKVGKRKTSESEAEIKKEKKDKKAKKLKKKDVKAEKSLTDDLPVTASALAEKRKVVIMQENQKSSVNEDNFDIPPLSAVQMSTTESELADIEKQIKSVKSRLGLMVESDSDDGDLLNLKAEPDELFTGENADENKIKDARKIQVVPPQTQKKIEHARITFDAENSSAVGKKKSVLERLGKRSSTDFTDNDSKKIKKDEERGRVVSVVRKPEETRERILSRLGVMSKVLVPEKPPEEEPPPPKEVPSVVKVKPRVLPPGTKQANKNLLLKAVAEAQRSVTQTPPVGNNFKPDALFTKRYKEKLEERKSTTVVQKATGARNIVVEVKSKGIEEEGAPKSAKARLEPNLEDMPTAEQNEPAATQKFIITLDGVENKLKKPPSPIRYDKHSVSWKKTVNVPDHLPAVRPSPTIKNKERCKYWPSCRHGEKCEFVHPSTPCKMFPQCKFGDKCLYIHPSCKFESSCTRKDCPYSHTLVKKNVVGSSQVCKYFPNCTNSQCPFYHPKLCKFGKFCKTQSTCSFFHPVKGNMTWKSKN